MSSEAITRNDLKAVLDEVLPTEPSEYKKLLWTNPSPTSSFSAQTLNVPVSDYDEIAIEYSDNTAYQGIRKTVLTKAGATSTYIFSCAGGNFARGITVTTTSVSFNNGMYYGGYGGTNASTNNTILIPIAIYGINYERVAPPQVEFEWEEITPLTVTVTTGSSGQQLHAYKRGRMLFFSLSNISRAANTSSGTNFWVADVSGLPASFINSVGCGYYDEKNIFVHFQSTSETTAKLTARVTGGTLNANSAVGSITTMTLFSS